MIHRYHGSKEGVRRALRRSLFRALVLEEKVETTLPRARELQRFAEDVVNRARANTVAARRRVFAQIGQDKKVLEKIFNQVVDAISGRPSGYTRIVRLGRRRGDGSMMVDVEWVDKEKVREVSKVPEVSKEENKKVKAKTEKKDSQ